MTSTLLLSAPLVAAVPTFVTILQCVPHADGVKEEAASGTNRKGESTDAEHRAEGRLDKNTISPM